MKKALIITVLACCIFSSDVRAANAIFTPIGSSAVTAGTNIEMTIAVATVALASFDAADIIIGSNDATDVAFVYDTAWTSAFANSSTPTFDVGFYNQDVFVGGNNSSPVGNQLILGTITINTTGMVPGLYDIRIDNTIDAFSRLILAGSNEPLNGSSTFEIMPPVPTMASWGLIVLSLLLIVAGSIILQRVQDQSVQARGC